MRGSLVTSAVLHALVLALALLALGSPAPFEVQDTESLPVDIVPIEELTKIQEGDKKAALKDHSSPKETKRQDKVDHAQHTGENNVDLKNPPTPSKRPEETQTAAAPKPIEKITPEKDLKSNDTKVIQKEETAAPKAEPKPAPAPAPKEEPKPAPAPDKTQQAQDLPTLDSIPVPEARPKTEPAKPVETAKAETKPETKPAETQTASKSEDTKKGKEKKETAKSATQRKSDKIADEVAALLNKEDSAGGGAKRSNQKASLGGKKTTGGEKLSQSEIDALRGVIQNNWNIIPGMLDASDIRIKVTFHLDRSGEIVGDPEVQVTGGSGTARDVLASSAKRAVLKSAPFTNLPADKYDAWSEVVVNFDPSDFM